MASKKSSKYATGGKIGRAKPHVPKAGATKSRIRRYGCGGKLKTK